MTAEPSCTPDACPGPANCGVHDHAPLRLPEVLARFDREARRGVFDTGRYRCSFYEWGQGPPLIFLHGLADTSRCFLPTIALLTRQFRCIAYDLPTGDADGARLGQYTHAALCDDLLALVNHLELRQSYLFGSSFGSTIALAALARAPQRFPRALLQAAVAHKPLRGLERPLAWLMSHLPGRVRRLPFREQIVNKLHRAPFLAQPLERWLHYLDYTGAVSIRALGWHARLLHQIDLRAQLAQIHQPLLLVCGDVDPVCTPAASEALVQALPAAGRVVLEGCGHIPSYTHSEALAGVVTQFLTPAPARVPLASVSASGQ